MKKLLLLLLVPLPFLFAQQPGIFVPPRQGGSTTATNLSGGALVQVTNIAVSLASSPTGGVALTAFDSTQFDTNNGKITIKNSSLQTNQWVNLEETNSAINSLDRFVRTYWSDGPFAVTNRYASSDIVDEVVFYEFVHYDGMQFYWGTKDVANGNDIWNYTTVDSSYRFDVGLFADNGFFTDQAFVGTAIFTNPITALNLTSNTLVSVAPGGILSTTILGANLSYNAATRTLSASGGVGDWFGQNSATNVIITNSTSSSATSLVLSNSTGNQLDTISFYHGGAAPDTSLSFDILAGSNTFRLFPGPLTSFPPFLTMDRMNRNLMLGYGGAVSLTSISNVADVHFPSNTYFYGPVTAGNGIQSTGSLGGSITFSATNNNGVKLGIANSNAIVTTNFQGTIELAAGTPTVLFANLAHNFVVTNRIGAATTFVLTNTVPGQEITLVVPGEASGGSDRVVTVVAHLGQLITDLDAFGVALATSTAQTLTNGNAVEYNFRIVRQLGASNFVNKVSQQYKF